MIRVQGQREKQAKSLSIHLNTSIFSSKLNAVFFSKKVCPFIRIQNCLFLLGLQGMGLEIG
jgi:hypothetical protein